MPGMQAYSRTATEAGFDVQEVVCGPGAKKDTWWHAAEIIGIDDRHMRRCERYDSSACGLLTARQVPTDPGQNCPNTGCSEWALHRYGHNANGGRPP